MLNHSIRNYRLQESAIRAKHKKKRAAIRISIKRATASGNRDKLKLRQQQLDTELQWMKDYWGSPLK